MLFVCGTKSLAQRSASHEEKKTYKPNNNCPLHLFIGKIKPPETIEETFPA